MQVADELDRDLETLRANAQRWARLGFAGMLRHLRAMRAATVDVGPAWAALAADAKGIAGTPLAGEEWTSGPYALLVALDRLGATIASIARTGVPPISPRAVRTRGDGQVVVDVFPVDLADRLLLAGIRGEVWMQPGVRAERVLHETAAALRRTGAPGRVTLVLGAGNIASIPPLDVLYALFGEGSVACLKLNPVNAYLEPVFRRIFASLIDDGYVRITGGGPETGARLVAHPGVDAIHLTGGERTFRAIAATANGKPITAELGNVTPVVVVPGPWSDADLRFQAAHLATMKLHNAGANCIAAQLVVTPAGWDKTGPLLAALRSALRNAPSRPAYYPGSAERIAAIAQRTGGELLGGTLFIPTLGDDDPLLCDEAFAPVLAHASLPGGDDPAAFLRAAVAFANERAAGTLGVSLLVHPATMRALGSVFDEAIAALRYGCVAINAWPGVGFLLPTASWGAYPGHTVEAPGSGIGVVHNAYLFDRPQKTVLRAPFRPFPTPPWFVTHRNAGEVGRRLFAFAARPSPLRLAATAIAALRA